MLYYMLINEVSGRRHICRGGPLWISFPQDHVAIRARRKYRTWLEVGFVGISLHIEIFIANYFNAKTDV